MKINATLYDGKSSKEHIVEVEFTNDKRLIVKDFGIDVALDSVDISSKLGSTPRVFNLPNGVRIKSSEHDKIEEIFNSLQIKKSKISKLESSWRLAIFSIVLIASLVIFMLTSGASYSAKILANILPSDILDSASINTLELLDKKYLHKSNLTKEKKEKILKLFKKLTNNDPKYKLHFRSSPIIGANAFALPSGDVVLLDELVFLDKDPNLYGVLGVLAHEKGHVVYKHSLQILIKGAVATTIISYITGDFSFIVTTLPTMVITSKYNREFETQADIYAKEQLKRLHISSKPLAKLFEAIEDYYNKKYGKDFDISWLSSHPVTKKRIEFFNK